MKYTMLFAALWWPFWMAAQTSYTFASGAGSWTSAASWNPIRTNPKSDDILQFFADAVVDGLPGSETIGKLIVGNIAQVKFTASAIANLIIGSAGLSSPHFNVAPGASLELAGSTDIHLVLPHGAKGIISGKLRVSGAPHRLEVSDSAALNFESGSGFTAAAGFTGNAFGTVNLNSVIFKAGSSYFSQDGGNPFGAAAPASVVIFESGSHYFQQQAIGLSLGGRTYGYLQTEANINMSLFGSVNDVTILNDLTINAGYFIFHPNTIHAGSFKIFGNIIQNGTAILDIGNANMTGSVQILGTNVEIGAGNGTGSCSFQNLFLNCNSTATAKRNFQVNGTLGLLHGNLATNSDQLLILGPSATLLSPLNAYGNPNEGWEQSYVDGPLELIFNSAAKKTAPVGNLGAFAPIRIEKANASAAIYTAQYFRTPFADLFSVNQPPLDHISHVEYWMISTPDQNNDAKLSLSWRPGSFVGNSSIERNDLALAHYVDFGFGLKWNEEGNSFANGDNNFGFLESANYITNFSEFTLASKSAFNVLPVSSVIFSAKESKGVVTLSWNKDPGTKHIVERRTENASFGYLRSVSPFVNTMFDSLETEGNYYYRLKSMDVAGNVTYSQIIRISFRENPIFSLYPNPCKDFLSIIFSTPRSTGTLELVNSLGQHLYTLSLAGNAVNTTWLNKGKYYIRYRDKNKVVTKAFIRL